jgi:hypothetical protein
MPGVVWTIDFAAEIARLTEGTKKGAAAVTRMADEMESASSFAKSALLALGTAIGAHSFASAIKSTADFEDELGKLSQKTGITVASLSALKYAGDLSDVSMESLRVGLGQLAKNMADAQIGTGEAQSAFAALGIQVAGARGQLKPTEQQLLEIADKFAGMADGAGKTALAMKIFGRSGADLIPLLNEGRSGIEAMRKEAEHLGIVIRDEASAAARDFNDNLTRLKSALEGVKIQAAGPVILALKDLTEQMLAAKAATGSFWAALMLGGDQTQAPLQAIDEIEGKLRTLRADREVLAGPSLAARVNRIMAPEDLSAINLQIKALEAQENTLRELLVRRVSGNAKGLVQDASGEFVPAPAKPNAPGLVDTSGKASEDSFLAKQLQEGVEEEQRVQAEALAATVAFRDAQLAKDREFYDNSIAAMMAYYDAEQERAIASGQALLEADGLSHATKLQMLSDQLDGGFQAEMNDYQRRLEALGEFSEEELAALGGYHAVKEKIEAEHMERLRSVRVAGEDNVQRMVRLARAGDVQGALGTFTAITAGLASHNKKMFELNKAAGITQAIISAYVGISKTLETYPFPLSAVMAAAQAAIAFAQVQAISSQSFGGGAAAPSLAGSTAAPAVTPVQPMQGAGFAAGQPQQPTQTTIVHLPPGFDKKQLYSGEDMFNLLKALEEATRAGGRVVVA